jgi:hypothetical protein
VPGDRCLARLLGNRNAAAYAFGRENEVNSSAKLEWDEFAYEAGAVPRLSRGEGRRAASLTPFDRQGLMQTSAARLSEPALPNYVKYTKPAVPPIPETAVPAAVAAIIPNT